ncbi:hypothetical protein L3X38_024515 [Prunus dulcis]|uniref:Uncharacterized protein n=1 Tax=Prunus dulcis TaxID=3755 RepID=A0AAD4W2N4_PRUDU|nr:hypothetical protein L3X38_024515 [Prunus dulcis]
MQLSFSLSGGCSSKLNSTVDIHEIWAYEVFPVLAALHLEMHEYNAYISLYYIGARFHELMSQIFENCEVDVKLLRPSVIEKQQPYWTWGDSVDDTEELVELFGNDTEQNTSTSASVEEKGGEGHEDIGSPHINKGGDNDLSPLHDYVSPPTEPASMETQVPGDGAEPSATMVVEEAEMAASVPHL